MAAEWLVIKLGGTSIARKKYWENIVARIDAALDARQRVLVVHSALDDTTDRLANLIAAHGEGERQRIVDDLSARHYALAGELQGLDNTGLDARFSELRSMMAVLPEAGRVSPLAQARLLAMGERLFTELALSFLQARELPVTGVNARDLLTVRRRAGAHPARHFLSAALDSTPDAAFAQRLRALSPIVLTQGFFARDEQGQTVLLGRGGSDVSAACLAVKLGSAELEVWTDVPGLFSADPNRIATARQLRELDYDEALEIAANGGCVLHPRCIPPLRRAAIPLTVRYTPDPAIAGTHIRERSSASVDGLKAICMRRHISVVTVETPRMWRRFGLLADMFACFKAHDLSVDMMATSQTSVTVSLDPDVNPDVGCRLEALCTALSELGHVEIKTDCAAISLVGRRIRSNLDVVAPLLKLFDGHRVHLLSQASNDLNMTFLVDECEASRLVEALHATMMKSVADERIFGLTWAELSAPSERHRNIATPWWRIRRDELLALAAEHSPRYVYDADTIIARVERLRHPALADRLFYAVKANDRADVLRLLHEHGLGFECVSVNELEYLLRLFPDMPRQRLLFTPNFAPRSEYAFALAQGVPLTLDNLYPLRAWPELLAGRDVFVRVDLGTGRGHHRYVRTAGRESKFGVPIDQLSELRALARHNATRVIGLHAHAGSGIMETAHWRTLGCRLAELAAGFPDLKVLNLGGGLGIPGSPGEAALDTARLVDAVKAVRKRLPEAEIWFEPGRFLVGEAGVLLARVTQLKGKGEVRYLGVDTGMNSLIRPALYDAWHPIVNLSRLDDSPTQCYTVVGPLCESGDVLGRARRLPKTAEGDVLLIANTGAYGRVMASHYNRRPPADEILLQLCDAGAVSSAETALA